MEKLYKIKFLSEKGDTPFVSFWNRDKNDVSNNLRFEASDAAQGGNVNLMMGLPCFEIYTVLNTKKKPFKNEKPYCDIPRASGFGYLFSMRAVECLKEVLDKHAYLHPVIHVETGVEYRRVFFTTLIKGVIDIGASDVELWPHGGLQSVNKLSIKDGITVPDAFKIAECPRGDVFFSQTFVDMVAGCGLTGIEFELASVDNQLDDK